MGYVAAIANQKGGVGKTTTAVNLSACIAEEGHRVLLIDLDPQGNATSGLGVDKNGVESTLYDALTGDVRMDEVILKTALDTLWLAPSNKDLVGAEVEFVDIEAREYRLRACLEPVRDAYDYIFIDCPPSLSLLTVNGLTAADGVLITLQCEYYALEGLSELVQTIKLVRDGVNSKLDLAGVLLTMHQHTKLSAQVVDEVRRHLPHKVYKTVIPRNVTLSEAPGFGMPVILYERNSSGAMAYEALAREVLAHG
jgi:chromosome partitioning protein